MAEAAKLLEVVKENLRATLLSVPGGLSLRGLLLDYKKMNGTELQFRQLGYSSPDELLMSMPDVVNIYNVAGEKNYVGVPDATTRHIQKLVSKQKVSNSGYPRNLKRNPFAPARAAPRVVQLPSDASMQRASTAGRRPNIDTITFKRTTLNILKPNNTNNSRPIIPAIVQMDIRDLLQSFPLGILLKQLNGAFQKKFTYNLDHEKYGFESISSMMSSIPEIVSLQNTGRELKVLPKKHPKSNNYPNMVSANNKTAGRVPPLMSVKPVVSHTRSASSPPALRSQSPRSILNHNQVHEEEEEEMPESTTEIGSKLKETIRKILSKYPEGINYLAFSAKYKEETGFEFIYQDLGFYSIMAFMSAIPDVVTCYRPHPQESWILYDARLRPKLGPVTKPAAAEELQVGPLPEEFKRKLIKVLEQFHPHGVSMSSIPRQYRTMYNEDMSYDKYGYSSLELLLVSLVDDIVKLDYFDEGVQVHLAEDAHHRYLEALPQNAYDSTAMQPSRDNHSISEVTSLPARTTESVECPPGFISPHHEIPVDACLLDKTISLQEIPSSWELRTYCRVVASHVENPGEFWIQLHGEDTSAKLTQLMDDLEMAYRMDSSLMEQYTIPPTYLQPGMLCVALYENDWHRAQIISLPDQENVKVSYIDYGTVGDVSRAGVKFLKERFATFPAQALQAKLANVVPLRNELQWSRTARNIFFKMSTKSKLLVAMLMAKTVNHAQNQVLSLCLTDMTDNNEIHINDLLVEKQLAEFAHTQDDFSDGHSVVPKPTVAPLAASPPVAVTPARAVPSATAVPPAPILPQSKDQDLILMQQACWNAVYANPMYGNSMFMYGSGMPNTLYPPLMQQQPPVYKPAVPPANYTSAFQSIVPPQGLMANPWSFGNMGMWPSTLAANNITNQFSIPTQQTRVPPATTAHQNMIHSFCQTTNNSTGKPFSTVPTPVVMPVTKPAQTFGVSPPVAAPIFTTSTVPSVLPVANSASKLELTSTHHTNVKMSIKEEKTTSATVNGGTRTTTKFPATSEASVTQNSVRLRNSITKVRDSAGEPDLNDIGSPVKDKLVASGDAPHSQNGLFPSSKLQNLSPHKPDSDEVEDDFNSYVDDDAYIEQLCRELDSIPSVKKRHIKLVELTPEHKVHLVFYQNQLHMVGFEVSAFLWKKDVLRNMIMIHRIKVVSHIITEESEPELFAELLQYHLRSSEACTSTLYPLSSVLQVLDKFKPTAEALRKAIVREQDTFNPHDSYWGSVNLSMNDTSTPRLTISELHEFTLGVLQNRRQEIMMQLQEEQRNSALLEELTLLNSRIEIVELENAGS